MTVVPARTRVMLLASVLVVLACSSCSSCSKTQATPADSGSDAAPRGPYAGPFEAHAVARSVSWRIHLVPLENKKTVLTTGIFRYELLPNGTAARMGTDASYLKQLAENDDHLGGYDVPAFVSDDVIPGSYDWRDLRANWRDRTVEREGGRELVEMPPGTHGGDVRKAADGTSVVITTLDGSHAPVTVIAAPSSTKGTVVPIDGIDGGTRDVSCSHVPSWQRPHVLCRQWRSEDISVLHRLAGERWERVPLPDDVAKGLTVAAVAPDGTVWLGANGEVVRVATAGSVQKVGLPVPDVKASRPFYVSTASYGRPQPVAQINEGAAGARAFERFDIMFASPTKKISNVAEIVPREDGEAWVLAHESTSLVVFLVGRPAMAPNGDLLLIGSEADQRNELRNTRPLVARAGHCAQLFVPLAKERVDGSLESAPIWAKERAIAASVAKVIAKVKGSTPDVALVEGRLGGRRVAGLLVWRGDLAVSEDALEKSVSALAGELSEDTGMPPEVTCSAPVLERASKL